LIIDLEHIKPLVQRLGDLEVRTAPASEFNGKLMIWFHPHKGGKTAQRWLKRRLLKFFPRTDFFMPSFLKKIDKPVALEIASELHLLVAAIFETARLNGRPYEEVVLVAYGEGVLILRKVEEFGNGHLQGHTLPKMAIPVSNSWNEIRHISRTVFIARGEALHKPPFLSHEPSGSHNLRERISGWLASLLTR
jgi:hypothetical protein